VVLFVHGGVWASGSKWHYARMASRLAEEGITTCVMEYTLFPDCTCDRMVTEVGEALDWVVDHCVRSKDQRVVLVGHSAGAHLCAMLLLERSSSAGDSSTCIPHRFVGMAGVYDIARHYDYETSRYVHHLSTMKRAVGGPSRFRMHSPAVLLRNAEEYRELDVRRLPAIHLMASRKDVTVPHIESADLHDVLKDRGCADVTLSLYEDVGHGDFVVEWQGRPRGRGKGACVEEEDAGIRDIRTYTSDLPVHAQDLIRTILSE
jgi:acetyl esterase/lipase